ncbi:MULTISPECIES: hypothetical protein [unclassified Paenibacillus]|uniref:hypothetical protein n=1 Tax=unclassified Paenibacillus TaxID=185978 RepID=UPI00363AADF4
MDGCFFKILLWSTSVDIDHAMNNKAESFREQLEARLKQFPPWHYAKVVSNIINDVFKARQHMGRYPLHFLIHSIQANCSYYNTNRNDSLTEKTQAYS